MAVTVNRQGVADSFGVALTTVDRWIRDGCPVQKRGSRGIDSEFILSDVIRWRTEKAVAEAAGNEPTDAEEVQLRKLVAETELAELKLAKERGLVAPVDEFERVTAKLLATIQTRVMNVPDRAALQLLGCTDEREFKSKLSAELRLALENAAAADINIEPGDEMEDEGE